jgi:hypothetical protein
MKRSLAKGMATSTSRRSPEMATSASARTLARSTPPFGSSSIISIATAYR